MSLRFWAVIFLLLLPFLTLAQPTDEPCWSDPDTPCLFIGEDPADVHEGHIQEVFVPPIDHHFRVVDVFWVITIEMGVEYTDCFVQVEVIETAIDQSIPVDGRGRPFVEDFDGILKPMDEIPIDLDTCSSPTQVPAEERNLP